MNYTIITYLSDGASYCRGCVMNQWSSEHEIFCFEEKDRAKAIQKYAEFLTSNEFLEYGSYEITCLFNGLANPPEPQNDDFTEYDELDKQINALHEEARLLSLVLTSQRKEQLAAQKIIDEQRQKEKERQEKLFLLQELQKELNQ